QVVGKLFAALIHAVVPHDGIRLRYVDVRHGLHGRHAVREHRPRGDRQDEYQHHERTAGNYAEPAPRLLDCLHLYASFPRGRSSVTSSFASSPEPNLRTPAAAYASSASSVSRASSAKASASRRPRSRRRSSATSL